MIIKQIHLYPPDHKLQKDSKYEFFSSYHSITNIMLIVDIQSIFV